MNENDNMREVVAVDGSALRVPMYEVSVHTPDDRETLAMRADAWNLHSLINLMEVNYAWVIADEGGPHVVYRTITMADILSAGDLPGMGVAWSVGTRQQHAHGWTGTLSIRVYEADE